MSPLTKYGPYCPAAPRSAKLGHLWPSPDQGWHQDSLLRTYNKGTLEKTQWSEHNFLGFKVRNFFNICLG